MPYLSSPKVSKDFMQTLRTIIGLVALLLTITVSARAQGTPPTTATNIVSLSPSTRLAWDANPEPDIAGYQVEARQGTNTFRLFTTNTHTPILLISTNLGNGPASFAVAAINRQGQAGPFATLSTNLSSPPSIVVRLRMELAVEIGR